MPSETQMRFTPAHAGNTFWKIHYAHLTRVHPRSRGEYINCTAFRNTAEGSPPLTRGIHLQCQTLIPSIRFTPAHAGNTYRFRRRCCLYRVHPRSRGEYADITCLVKLRLGSPPLTRGILISTGLKIKVLRFTPAHAGNTKTAAVNAWRMAGSPPLTRGILISILQCQGVCRFTPAHAGNT